MSTDPSDTTVTSEQYWSTIKEQRQQALRLIAERDQARAWACALWEALTPDWKERIIAAQRELPNWLATP